jgi:hypothetical protein
VDVRPGGLDPAWRIDRVLLVYRIGECRFPVLREPFSRVGVAAAVEYLFLAAASTRAFSDLFKPLPHA